MSDTKKEVVKKGGSEVAVGDEYGQWGNQGFESTTQEDLSIPLISVLQSISPQVEDQTVEGSKAGHLYNTVTGEVQDVIHIIPVEKQRVFIEWVPRDSGGGFVAIHEPDSEIVKKAIEDNGGSVYGNLVVLESGNELEETHQVYVLITDEAGENVEGFAVIPFTSSKIKVIKKWFTSLYMMKGNIPLFANRAKLSTVKQKNSKGTFYNLKVEPLLTTWKESLISPSTPEGAELLEEGANFRKSVTSGEKQANYNSASKEAGADGISDDQF